MRPGVTESVVLMFSRREVESGDPSASVTRLNALFGTRDAIWRYRGQVALNAIFDDHRFPESDLEQMSNGVIEVIEQAGIQ